MIKIVTPYIRRTKDEVLIGTKLADSIYQVREPQLEDMQKLYARAVRLKDPELMNYIAANESFWAWENGTPPYIRTSAAKYVAAEIYINELEKIQV